MRADLFAGGTAAPGSSSWQHPPVPLPPAPRPPAAPDGARPGPAATRSRAFASCQNLTCSLHRTLFQVPRGVNKLILVLKHAKCFVFNSCRTQPCQSHKLFYTLARVQVAGRWAALALAGPWARGSAAERARPGEPRAPPAPRGDGSLAPPVPSAGRPCPRAPLLALRGGSPAEGCRPSPPRREAASGAGKEPPAAISRPGSLVAVRSPPPAWGRAPAPSALPAAAPTRPRKHQLPRPAARRPRGSRCLPSVKLPGRPQGEAGRQEQPQRELHGRQGGPPRRLGLGSRGAPARLAARRTAGQRGPAAADTGCAATDRAARPCSLSARRAAGRRRRCAGSRNAARPRQRRPRPGPTPPRRGAPGDPRSPRSGPRWQGPAPRYSRCSR